MKTSVYHTNGQNKQQERSKESNDISFTYTFGYELTYPSEKEGARWREYIAFANYQEKELTEGEISNLEFESNDKTNYKATIRAPYTYAHNQTSATYKEYTYQGENLDGMTNFKNWVANEDIGGAFSGGFKSGVTVALMDRLVNVTAGSILKRWKSFWSSQIAKWKDLGGSRKFSLHEISRAVDFEVSSGIRLKQSIIKIGGDSLGAAGKYAGKVFDHFGML